MTPISTLPLPLRIMAACSAAGISPIEVIGFHIGLVGVPQAGVIIPPGGEEAYEAGLGVRTGVLEEQAR